MGRDKEADNGAEVEVEEEVEVIDDGDESKAAWGGIGGKGQSPKTMRERSIYSLRESGQPGIRCS